MMNRNQGESMNHSHLNETVLYDYVQGELETALGGLVEAHLERCLACRVWAARLRHASIPKPDDAVISSLVEASPTLPAALHEALTVSQKDQPNPVAGEVWRVGKDEALLVWVRRVLDDSAIGIPVVFDEELADNFSLIVPAGDSPIQINLVLLTAIEGHIDFRAFLNPIGPLTVDEDIETIREARRNHQPLPSNVLVGAPIVSSEDQRLEYRQVVADLLGDLSPEAFLEPDESMLDDEGFDVHGFTETLQDVTWRRAGVRIKDLDMRGIAVDPAHELLVVAMVEDLDASVFVGVLTGAEPTRMLETPEVATACGTLLRQDASGDAVAVAIPDTSWSTVVIDAPFASSAIEAPIGRLTGPRVSFEPLDLVDALVKYFDAHATRWTEDDGAEFDRQPIQVSSLAIAHAKAAIERINASGRKSRPPKREVYVGFAEAEINMVAELIKKVTDHKSKPSEAIEHLIQGNTS